MVKLRQVMHDIMEKPTILHKGEVESSMGHLEQVCGDNQTSGKVHLDSC